MPSAPRRHATSCDFVPTPVNPIAETSPLLHIPHTTSARPPPPPARFPHPIPGSCRHVSTVDRSTDLVETSTFLSSLPPTSPLQVGCKESARSFPPRPLIPSPPSHPLPTLSFSPIPLKIFPPSHPLPTLSSSPIPLILSPPSPPLPNAPLRPTVQRQFYRSHILTGKGRSMPLKMAVYSRLKAVTSFIQGPFCFLLLHAMP
ncbi:unnamed protein product [Closterium sp. Naga37s-1]|nr:unnamed protein product [Closterium sp. Naga37s-1]